MDATHYMQSISDLKTSNPAEYKQRYEKLVAKIDLKIYGVLEGRQQQQFSELVGRSIQREAPRQ